MSDLCVVGILVNNRANRAPEVQQVITRYGSAILSRNGVPDPTRERGIITLTMQADEKTRNALIGELQQISGVNVSSLVLGEPLQ